MFTEDDKRELKRLMQKLRRSLPTGTRRAMLAWNNGEKGKAAQKRWLENGGAELKAARRAPGSQQYINDKAKDRASIARAAKHRHAWTATEEAELLAMHKQGKKTREIAAALSRSFRGVERKRERLKAATAKVIGAGTASAGLTGSSP